MLLAVQVVVIEAQGKLANIGRDAGTGHLLDSDPLGHFQKKKPQVAQITQISHCISSKICEIYVSVVLNLFFTESPGLARRRIGGWSRPRRHSRILLDRASAGE